MQAIAISGSPRRNGNTDQLCQRCLAGLEAAGFSTRFESLAGKRIAGCTGCGWCRKHDEDRCVIDDDDFLPLYRAMEEADVIVVGSPVYFGSATPEMMALLDRAGYVARGNGTPFSRKIGAPIAVARRAGQNFTFAQLLYWFTINDMVVPGSRYWNIAFGKDPGDVTEDAEGLATIDRLAENLAWVAQRLRD